MSNVVVIVGCSKGFGRALMKASLQNARITRPDSTTRFVVLTTSKENGINTWNEVYEEVKGKNFYSGPSSGIEVFVEQVDLLILDDCHRIEEVLRLIFGHFHFDINDCFVLMNAGSVTPVGPLIPVAHHSPTIPTTPRSRGTATLAMALSEHCNLNFISFTVLLRCILQLSVSHRQSRSLQRVRVVNVSSLAAVKNLEGMAVYGAIKSARECIIRAMSSELEISYPHLDVRMLNYAPGPMETELVMRDLLGTGTPDNFTKRLCGSFVDKDESAKKCLDLLTCPSLMESWQSGAHIDFFDEICTVNRES